MCDDCFFTRNSRVVLAVFQPPFLSLLFFGKLFVFLKCYSFLYSQWKHLNLLLLLKMNDCHLPCPSSLIPFSYSLSQSAIINSILPYFFGLNYSFNKILEFLFRIFLFLLINIFVRISKSSYYSLSSSELSS